jgi:hypothetical protein
VDLDAACDGEVLMRDENPRDIWNQHEAMLASVAEGDGAAAEELAREHVTQAANFLITRLRSQRKSAPGAGNAGAVAGIGADLPSGSSSRSGDPCDGSAARARRCSTRRLMRAPVERAFEGCSTLHPVAGRGRHDPSLRVARRRPEWESPCPVSIHFEIHASHPQPLIDYYSR